MIPVSYYPGCTIKASAQNYETSALALLHALGIQPREMEQWNCCGVVHSLTSDNLIRQVAPIRVFSELQHQGSSEVVTFCDMCYNTLSQANLLVENEPEKGQVINEFIDASQSYDGHITVLHLLQVLRDRIGFATVHTKVKQPLKGLNIFPYYGCKLLRPSTVGIDDAEDPTILRDLMQALGVTVIDDPIRIECCGSHHVVNNDDLVVGRIEKIVSRAQSKGADAIVLSCPLCMFNFDTRQHCIAAPLPVFYFTQLICLALGLEQATLGLDDHRIDPRPLLIERGFLDGSSVVYSEQTYHEYTTSKG